MARLPKLGGDADKWAALLNEYLLVSHNPDGTPRSDTYLASVGLSDLRTANPPSTPINNLMLSNDGTNLVWRKDTVINIRDYGAMGDGVTDDTNAIQSAINAASAGGSVVFPRGTYMVRTLKISAKGTQLTGTRGGVRLRRLSGTEPLIDMSGTASLDSSHLRYCSLFSLTLDGNNLPGTLVRSYYADTCVYRDVSFINCPDVALDCVELWDTRFYDCSWEFCGTNDLPATLFRNSTAPGTFGYSTDNTNQIQFLGCRWEAFRNGALRLDGKANGSTTLLNGVFLVSCKMETSLAAGPALQIMSGTTIIFSNQLYLAILKAAPEYTTPIDAVIDSGTHIDLSDTYMQWGSDTGLANSTIHAFSGGPHTYRNLSAYYPTEPPAVASIIIEPGTTARVSSPWANRGQPVSGDITTFVTSDPNLGVSFPIKNSGAFKISSTVTGKDLYKADNSSVRPTLQTLNGSDFAGFSGDYSGEKWRFHGDTGFVSLASGNFQIEGTKGYVGVGTSPYTNIAFLIKMVADTDRGLTIVRSSSSMTGRLIEFQDENHDIQGITFDAFGRPLSVGKVANVAPGDQVSYANPRVQARDIAGSVTAAVVPNPTVGSIAVITFSKPFPNIPLSIVLSDHSVSPGVLYVSARSTTGFTVSTRRILQGGSIVDFDYMVMGQG